MLVVTLLQVFPNLFPCVYFGIWDIQEFWDMGYWNLINFGNMRYFERFILGYGILPTPLTKPQQSLIIKLATHYMLL